MYFIFYLVIPLIQTMNDDEISLGYGEITEVDSESDYETDNGGYQIKKQNVSEFTLSFMHEDPKIL